MVRYFEWMGAAVYTADHRAGAMHGQRFLVDSVYAGIDEKYVYGRLDFTETVPAMDFQLLVNLESWAAEAQRPRRSLGVEIGVEAREIRSWRVSAPKEEPPLASSDRPSGEVTIALVRDFEFKLPLAWLLATPVAISGRTPGNTSTPIATKLRLRFSVWQSGLPVDALPLEGWIELQLLSEGELAALAF
jgi:hypothetical protein